MTLDQLRDYIERYEKFIGGRADTPRRLHNYILKRLQGGMDPQASTTPHSQVRQPQYTPHGNQIPHHHVNPHHNHREHPGQYLDSAGNTPRTIDNTWSPARQAAARASVRWHPQTGHGRPPPNTPSTAEQNRRNAPTPLTDVMPGNEHLRPADHSRKPYKPRKLFPASELEGGENSEDGQFEGGNWFKRIFKPKEREEMVPLPVQNKPHQPAQESTVRAKPVRPCGHNVYDPDIDTPEEWLQVLKGKQAKYQALFDHATADYEATTREQQNLDPVQDEAMYSANQRRLELISEQRDNYQTCIADVDTDIAKFRDTMHQLKSNEDQYAKQRYRHYLESTYDRLPRQAWPPEEDWVMLGKKYIAWENGPRVAPFGIGGVGYSNPNMRHIAPPKGRPPNKPRTFNRPQPPPPPVEFESMNTSEFEHTE